MGRVDLFSEVHKGLRAQFSRAATGVGRTDFRMAAEAASALAEVHELLACLREHAQHEDAAILAVLAPLAPELHAQLSADHARTDALELDIERLAERIHDSVSQLERESLGRRLHERLWALFAEHLRHMAVEETQANRILWAHHTDAQLRAIQAAILGTLAPARLARWLGIMLPAMHGAERGSLLARLHAQDMPHARFEELTAEARAALRPAQWVAALAACPSALEPVA